MLKECGYQEKIEMLHPWLEEIIDTVKKDLKNEHLKVDKSFCRKYFLGKNPTQVTTAEMAVAYRQEIAEGNVGLGEFIATRWLLKNTDIYGYFEGCLKSLTEDFDGLEVLPTDLSEKLLRESLTQFGPQKTYLFCVLNSVVFPPHLYQMLKTKAEEENHMARIEEAKEQAAESLEMVQKRHAREMAAMGDRYEKKLSGLQRKYLKDMESMKKQISHLQKKLG